MIDHTGDSADEIHANQSVFVARGMAASLTACAVTDAQVQLNKDLDKLDKLEDLCAMLEMASVVWPKNRW